MRRPWVSTPLQIVVPGVENLAGFGIPLGRPTSLLPPTIALPFPGAPALPVPPALAFESGGVVTGLPTAMAVQYGVEMSAEFTPDAGQRLSGRPYWVQYVRKSMAEVGDWGLDNPLMLADYPRAYPSQQFQAPYRMTDTSTKNFAMSVSPTLAQAGGELIAAIRPPQKIGDFIDALKRQFAEKPVYEKLEFQTYLVLSTQEMGRVVTCPNEM